MSVHLAIRKVLKEYLEGKRVIDDCSVPGIKWHSLRRVLLASKKYYTAPPDRKAQSWAEKKRAESRFWLENGIRWPHD